jgi:predicted AAA+ superfamily ATPase
MREVQRSCYLNQLIRHKHNGLIKIISGIRRCGKSYLLSELFKTDLLVCGVLERHKSSHKSLANERSCVL